MIVKFSLSKFMVAISFILFMLYGFLPCLVEVLPSIILKFGYIIIVFFALAGSMEMLQTRKDFLIFYLEYVIAIVILIFFYLGKLNPIGNISFQTFIISCMTFLIGMSYYPFIDLLDEKEKKFYIGCFLCLLSVTSITTIVGNILHSGASRAIFLGGNIASQYTARNIGGYSFCYSLPISIVYLLGLAKDGTNKFRIASIVCLILCIATLFITQFTIAIIVTALVFLVLFFRNGKNSVQKGISVLIIIVLMCVLFSDAVLSWLSNQLTSMGLHTISDRIQSLIYNMNTGETTGDLTKRLDAYATSIQAFLRSPIFGNIFNQSRIGVHSDVLDLLAAVGIFGFVPAILVAKYYIQKVRVRLQRSKYYDYFKTALFGVLIICTTNTFIGYYDLAFVTFSLPLLLKERTLGDKLI